MNALPAVFGALSAVFGAGQFCLTAAAAGQLFARGPYSSDNSNGLNDTNDTNDTNNSNNSNNPHGRSGAKSTKNNGYAKFALIAAAKLASYAAAIFLMLTAAENYIIPAGAGFGVGMLFAAAINFLKESKAFKRK